MNDFGNLLASVIANTQAARNGQGTSGPAAPSGPRVVSEQHDTSKINWVAGMSDPGEMIGCGQYQQLRRLNGETDADYQKRLTALLQTVPPAVRAKIMAFGIRAASNRAALDNSTGRIDTVVNVRNKPTWHGLGVSVDGDMTSAEVQQHALNWAVSKDAMYYKHPITGEMVQDTESFAIVRGDTGAKLGTVGTKYTPFQNAEAFAFLDGVLSEFGARYESAGSLYGGRKVWALVNLPQQAFKVNGVDEVKAYACFTNSHDGSETAKCFATNFRVECANTRRQAVREDGKDGIAIRHTGNLKARVNAAREALGLTVRAAAQFKDAAEHLARVRVEPEPYFHGLLDAVCQVTQAQANRGADALALDYLAEAVAVTDAQIDFERKRYQRAIDTRGNLLNELAEFYDSKTNGVGGMRGTGWAALNAATESANHGSLGGRQQGDKDTRASRKFESVLHGNADAVMQIAYQQVLAAAGR